jgi:hypothetical protein
MRVKDGVSFDGARPELLRGLAVADEVYRHLTDADCIVTSCVRPNAMLHTKGLAADLALRTWDWVPFDNVRIDLLLEELRWRLGKPNGIFDVVDERAVPTGSHIHIEVDP